MIITKEKNYKVVDKNHKGYRDKVYSVLAIELGITIENFENSDKIIVNNNEGVEFGTLEFVDYNKGNELAELEECFNFRQFQSENVNLFYMDKVTIAKEERGKLENMHHMMQTIFSHMSTKREIGKETIIVALVRNKFFRYLKRMVCLDIIQLGPEQEGEIPMMIKLDSPENAHKLRTNTWCKFKI